MNKTFVLGRSRRKHILMLLSFVVLFVVISFSMYLNHTNSVVFPIWALWGAFGLFSIKELTRNERSFVIISFVFLTIELLYKIVGYSSMGIEPVVNEINWIMAGVVAIFAMNLLSGRELSIVYRIMAISFLLLMFVFIVAGRSIMVYSDDSEAATVANAWYGSLYMLFSGLSLIVFLNVKKLLLRIISIIVLALTLYLNVFVLQRGTNVLFTAAELGLILVFMLKRKSLIIVLSVLIVGFLVFVLSSDYLIPFFSWLADITPSERLSSRFNDIALSMAYSDIDATEGSFAIRFTLMQNSWNSFTSSFGHFLFGAGEHFGDNKIIGHHSFFLDTLGRYGILGGTLMFFYFKKQYLFVMSYLDKNHEWSLYMQCAIVFLFYVLRNTYGILSYALVNFFILMFLPLTFQIIRHYNK